jgi:alpha-galactosidase
MERLVTEYPDILLETCAGGGGRFDAGMLYYSPQIWCSDNTDACDRLRIQYGASLFMPPSAIGAHVSVCPNHANGRFTPMDTRANVAMNGTFGYELDVTRLTDADKAQIPQQIQRWHQVSGLVRDGAQYRLGNPFAAGGCAAQSQTGWDAWLYVSQDQSQALLTYVQITAEANLRSRRIRLAGLNETALYRYQLGDTEEVRTGAYLMQCGILIRSLGGDMQSVQILLSCAQAVPAQ